MAQTTDDKPVSKVYETFDYDKFTVLPENRGHVEQKGIKEKKVKHLQLIINSGRWIPNMSRVRVNELFEVIDGAHTLEVCRRNKLAVRYEVITGEHFNNVTKREKVGNIYSINSSNTAWTPAELFNSAVQCRAPLALIIREIIEANDNTFIWTDVMALLEKDSSYFSGRWRKTTMQTFERKDLIEYSKSEDFKYEVNFFVKFNQKVRIARRKSVILSGAYEILWNLRAMIDPKLFRKSLLTIPDSYLQSERSATGVSCRRMLIHHYNKSQGQTLEITTVLYALKHKDTDEIISI